MPPTDRPGDQATKRRSDDAALVTGIAGFIGSALARRLLAEGREVIGVDSLHTGKRDNVPAGAEFIEGDLRFPETVETLGDRHLDAIFHVAGQSGGEPSYDDPVFDLQANVQSTLLLLQHARRIGCQRFVYASSVSVYGDQAGDGRRLPEDTPRRPNSLYGVGKLASEHYLRLYAEQFGLAAVALRLFNIYGPGQDLDNLRQGMISIYLSQALAHGHIHVKGAADRFRDFVYVDDAVDAFLKVAELPTGMHTFNVCSGTATRVDEAIEHIAHALSGRITTEFGGRTPGDVHGWLGDPSRLVQATGWQPTVPVDEGIPRMVEWASEQQSCA